MLGHHEPSRMLGDDGEGMTKTSSWLTTATDGAKHRRVDLGGDHDRRVPARRGRHNNEISNQGWGMQQRRRNSGCYRHKLTNEDGLRR